MVGVALVALAVLAGAGWGLTFVLFVIGARTLSERDEYKRALDRIGKLPADESTFVRVHADALREVVAYASAWGADVRPTEDLRYLEERLRTVRS